MKITIDIPEHIYSRVAQDPNARIPIIESLVHISVRENMHWCVLPERIMGFLEDWSERDNFPLDHLIGKLVVMGLEQAMLTGQYPINPDTGKNLATKFVLAMFSPENPNYNLDPVELMLLASSLHIPLDVLEEALNQGKTRLEAVSESLRIKRVLMSKLLADI